MIDKTVLREIWERHSGKIIGVATGLLIGILVIALGFWRTLFLAICVSVGFYIGKKIDDREDLSDIWDRFIPPGYHK